MSRYAAAHAEPNGPGDARPTAIQIIKDEGVEGKLVGKVIVITGCSAGLGIETARALSITGATLYLTARDVVKAKNLVSEFLQPGSFEVILMDNTSFESVRAAASTILQKTGNKVNILINNAGVMAIANRELTKDGHEMQFGTNHLSHFLFFQLLKPALLASSTPNFHSRVVNLSSSAHHIQSINESDNYDFQKGDYDPWKSYGQSKTANIYMTNEIDRRYGAKGLHATAVHPGIIMTGLMKHMDPNMAAEATKDTSFSKVFKSPEQGAATTVYAAIGKDWENKGGRFLEDCSEAKKGKETNDIQNNGYNPHAYSPERESRLWKDSLKIVGLEDDA